jgi:hypothetical protein
MPHSAKRYWFYSLVVLLLITMSVVIVSFSPRSGDQIIRVNYDKIKEGMTQDEVEEILGGPPGVYSERSPSDGISFEIALSEPCEQKLWLGKRGVAHVWFNQRGRVIYKRFEEESWTILRLLTEIRERVLP